ncbi:MAG TPA: DUF3443 family protein [Rhodocyclaceae bacterium]|nr:DUF3443 family protein [Rhodocyclaceae bacterium]
MAANRIFLAGAVLALAVLAASCGGGGGGGGGGGSGGSSSTSSSSGASGGGSANNLMTVTVERGPGNNINIPYVSVTICAPGSTTNCQTIDHILLDTGSTGLRVVASLLSANVVLPQQADGSGNAIAECVAFVDGYVWGSVRQADVTLGGLTASAIPIQLIGDPALSAVPTGCSSRGAQAENTPTTLFANGVLGVSTWLQDCGDYCAQLPTPDGHYYICPSATTCTPTTVATADQIPNPVAKLVAENNGVIIEFPAVAAAGASSATGTMTLGIDTQSNNALGTLVAFDLDPYNGAAGANYGGQSLEAYFDTGSNGIFFPDGTIAVCSSTSNAAGFFCPTSTLNLNAIVQGYGSVASSTVDFSVANADQLVSAGARAFSNLAAPADATFQVFDWGMPFFYGRRVAFAIEQTRAGTRTGPFIAF